MPEKHEPSMDFGPTPQFDSVYMHDALPPGARLGGYQLIEVLGRGGFGIVYLALDSSLQRQVAIKEYFPAELAIRCEDGQVWLKPGADPAAYGAGMKAFLAEAKMLARFDHPSLARVLTFWEENRSAYMVMPYYDGRTLAAVLAERKTPPDEAWLRSLLSPLLSALSTLHNAQCLHLDISPDNIIVLNDGRPVLLDFGVANRLATDKTMPLTALLNPAYAPIEQYSESINLQQGAWSDLYALAGVLHLAIAGVPPARATVRAIDDPQRPLAETVASRSKLFPGMNYSASFLAAIDKALAVRPRDRPRSAAEFQHLLDHMPAAADAQPPVHEFFAGLHANANANGTGNATGANNGPAQAAAPAPAPAFAQEAWFAAEPMDAPPRPTRSRTPVWVATIAILGLAAAGWTWLQRQPSFATITTADLPPAVVARIPKLAPEGASAVAPLPTEPTAAGPAASATAPPVAAVASAPTSAAVAVAQPASAAAPQAPAAPAPATTAAAAKPKPAAARPAPAPAKTRVAKATTPRSMLSTPPPAEAASDEEPAQAAQQDAKDTQEAEPTPPATVRKPPPKTVASALPPEPTSPRAACGGRSNFALVYCMQQQCKRWKFSNHAQCVEMERRGEL